MSGEQNLAKTNRQKYDILLDEYEGKLGLPSVVEAGGAVDLKGFARLEEVHQYLEMSRDEIEALDASACAGIAYVLEQFAMHVQRAQNREIARVNWAKACVKETIANELNDYKGYGYEEKSMQAIKGNDVALTYDKIARYAQQRVDRLQFIAASIKNLANILLAVMRNKQYKGVS
jgi:hypothetical protein